MDYKDSDGKVIQQRRVNVSEDGNLMRITDVFHPAGGGHHLTIFSRKQ
jgi:hypothetical protein